MRTILAAWRESWGTVRAVVRLAGWVLVALGVAKLVAVGRDESASLGVECGGWPTCLWCGWRADFAGSGPSGRRASTALQGRN